MAEAFWNVVRPGACDSISTQARLATTSVVAISVTVAGEPWSRPSMTQ
jgi:hypothetical protein